MAHGLPYTRELRKQVQGRVAQAGILKPWSGPPRPQRKVHLTCAALFPQGRTRCVCSTLLPPSSGVDLKKPEAKMIGQAWIRPVSPHAN